MKWFLLVIATVLEAQTIKPDTRALAATLKAARAAEQGVPQYPAIRKSFLAWVDVRLQNPDQIGALDQELKRAKMSGPGKDEFWGTDNTGLLEIAARPIPSAPDLFAVRLGIGAPSGYDETIVLYQRQPWRRIGWLNHDIEGDYSQFSSLAIGEKDADGRRLIASGGFPIMRRYNGPLSLHLRVDTLEGESMTLLLSREVTGEYNYLPGKDGLDDLFVASSVEGNIASFRYTRQMRNEEYAPAIYCYSFAGNVATRIAPIAITRTGFIDEWIRMDPREAAHWSAPEALAGHRAVNDFLQKHNTDDHVYFEKISRCGNSPRTWQISAASAFNAPVEKWFFLLSESGAANLRMLSVQDEPRPGCVEYDLGTLNEELPQP